MKGGAGATLASLAVAQVHPIRFTHGDYSKGAAVALPDPFHHFPPPQLTPGWPIFSAAVEPLRAAGIFDGRIMKAPLIELNRSMPGPQPKNSRLDTVARPWDFFS